MLHAILVLMLNKQIPCGNIYVKMLINREKKINKRECMALFPYFFIILAIPLALLLTSCFLQNPQIEKTAK